MTTIREVVIQEYSETYYPGVKGVVDNASAHISFWGSRYITAKGYEGSLTLKTLVSHIRDVIITKDFHIKQEDRPIGLEISARITALYDESDEKLKNAWLITRILCWLRECEPFMPFHDPFASYTRAYWGWDQRDWFTSYTEEQYQKIYNESPKIKLDRDKGSLGYSTYDSFHPNIWRIII